MTAVTAPPDAVSAPPSLADQLLTVRLKLCELWHLIAIHVSDDRSSAVPEPLIREAARYLSAHPPEEWPLAARRPGPERTAAAAAVADRFTDGQLAQRIETAKREVEYARTIFRAVADLVDPIDPAVLEAEARASLASPAGQSIAEVLAEFDLASGG